MKKIYFLIFILLQSFYIYSLDFAHAVDFSLGWENIGLSPETTWMPYAEIQHTQGSRKELSASFTYHFILNFDNSRFFYKPSIGLDYGATWSLAGAMNVLGLNLSPLCFGVYMTDPMSAYEKNELKGKIFATFDLNPVGLSLGGNMTHDSGIFGSPEREWTDPEDQFGTQYYPFGHEYSYFKYTANIAVRFWGMITDRIGLGMSFASDAFILETPVEFFNKDNMPPALGYNVIGGLYIVIL
ncbi:MAG: hypothetical protein JXR63_02290 [Spirochaetales bacterium]|nr:hypothetical protein [Spirochaetales bacterium]